MKPDMSVAIGGLKLRSPVLAASGTFGYGTEVPLLERRAMGGMVSSVYAATYPGRAKALIVVDSNLVMSPERLASFQTVADRPAREYASQAEFIVNYRVRPGASTAPPEALRHIAQYSGRRFDDGRWRHKVDRRTYANRELVDIRAFSAADLNVAKAAEQLHVHPNTVRYRLQQIATKTGYDPRTFAGLVDLICILEMTDDDQQP